MSSWLQHLLLRFRLLRVERARDEAVREVMQREQEVRHAADEARIALLRAQTKLESRRSNWRERRRESA